MQENFSFQRYSYSGLDPALAFDIVYGGHFEHRLLSAKSSNMAHQRLTLHNMMLETGSYDFPVAACGVMPKDRICIGLVAEGIQTTRYNTMSIDDDEIQIYPPGSELLYHSSGSSRWINCVIPESLLQSVAIAQTGTPLALPTRGAVSIRLPVGGRARLARMADDAFAMVQALAHANISDQLVNSISQGLVETCVSSLLTATLTDGKRMSVAQQHLQVVLRCERLALTEDSMHVELDEIAKRSGYGRRALELIFNSAIGMPPGRWFMNIRLNGVLRELLTASPNSHIIDIANRWGFTHLSRFAYQYRRAFGELPRETLRRANCR